MMDRMHSPTAPRVTVLLPVYNGERYLRSALDSIFAQTFTDFELLVIDDGSSDGTAGILRSYSDTRLRVVRHEQNMRLIGSLNEGFQIARGEFIARMDADDISFPDRLEKQVRFLDDHPEVAVVGGDIIIFSDDPIDGRRPILPPLTNAEIHWDLLRTSSLSHPTVMVRKSAMGTETAYNKECLHCEDYDLWLRLSRRAELANLPDPVLYYRVHPNSVSSQHAGIQRSGAEKVLAQEIERRIGRKPSEVTTGLLMQAARLHKFEAIDEYVTLFPLLIDEALKFAEKGKVTAASDQTAVQMRALLATLRLIARAAVRKPKHLPILFKLLGSHFQNGRMSFAALRELFSFSGQVLTRRWL